MYSLFSEIRLQILALGQYDSIVYLLHQGYVTYDHSLTFSQDIYQDLGRIA